MTAAAVVSPSAVDGLRPVDPRRDLVGLADLIETAFAETLDRQGHEMTSEMRRFGRLGWLGWMLGHLVLPPAAFPQGYVWTEDGVLVGNASLLPVESAPQRWVLANVSVLPGRRRRGIARALVAACLELAAARSAEEVILQVKAGNEGARSLYAAFGFESRGTRVTWRQSRPIGFTATDPARRRHPGEWEAHWELIQGLHPHGLVWPYPLRRSMFRPPSWPTGGIWEHWVWPESGPIAAAASGRIDSTGAFHVFLVCSPASRGRAEAPLVETIRRDVSARGGLLRIETDDDPEGPGLAPLGFLSEQRLTWMGRFLAPQAAGVGDEPS